MSDHSLRAQTRVAVGAVLLASLSMLTACGEDQSGGNVTSDCERGVLFNGDEYVGTGYFLDEAGAQAGTAALARCEDTSKDSDGLVFAEDGEDAAVWRIGSTDAADAVGLEVESRYEVLVNQGLSPQDRSDLLRTLGLGG